MKVLITGGAGYIGNVLTRELLKNNYKVTIIDNFGYNQQASLLSISKDKNLEIIKSDVRNLDILNNEIKKHDVIIPLAAVVGAPACDLNLNLQLK